jgi:Sec-independent protein translocase protein TatA
MFDSRLLIVILVPARIIVGTTRFRPMGAGVGAAVKGFGESARDGDSAVHDRLQERLSRQD